MAQTPPPSGMLRSGWTSPVYNTLRVVPDPLSRTTLRVVADRRDAGYWSGSGDDAGDVAVFHFEKGTSLFESGYGNARTFALLDRTFYDMALLERMDYVTVIAAASPEGLTADNERLAAERALAIKDYIAGKYPYVNRDRIITFSAGSDWHGLRRMIETDPYVPSREDALRLLNSPLPGDVMRERLGELAGGSTYSYISEHMFPQLRGGAACMIYFKDTSPSDELAAGEQAAAGDGRNEMQPAAVGRRRPADPADAGSTSGSRTRTRQIAMRPTAIKTNLLYDATGTINFGVETRTGTNTSLELPVNYNAWDFTATRKWRHVLVQPEFRWWPRGSFRGHFFGLHAHYAFYNVGDIPVSDYMRAHRLQGWLAGAGVSYGHRWNFSRRWGLEATIGAGYAYLSYDRYASAVDGALVDSRTASWLGPTRAAVTLIYMVGGRK